MTLYLSNTYKIAICDRCNTKYPHAKLRRDGDINGLMVCHECWDPRDPRRDMRSKAPRITIMNPRPDIPLNTPIQDDPQ